MGKSELQGMEARMDAMRAITFKLFEMLAFISPLQARKAADFLGQYADEVAQEGETHSSLEAGELRSFVSLARQALAHRESAVAAREVLERIRSRRNGDEQEAE